jgi:hypothetical protein
MQMNHDRKPITHTNFPEQSAYYTNKHAFN